MEPQKKSLTNQKSLKDWGLEDKKESIDKMQDFPQVYNIGQLPVGKSFSCVIDEEQPRKVIVNDVYKGAKTETLVINVIDDLTKMRCSIFLSSITLRMKLFKLLENKKAKGFHIKITPTEYMHSEYKKMVRGYNVEEIL